MSFSETPEADELPPPTVTSTQLRKEAEQASRIAAELRRQATIAAKAERDARRPAMPEAGSIVIFTRYQSGRAYQYAAVSWRVGEHVRWAVTGTEARQFNWPGLLGFIGEINWDTIAVVTGSRHLVAPGDEPAAAQTVGRYGRRNYGNLDVDGSGQYGL
jgi:hypothetical protein